MPKFIEVERVAALHRLRRLAIICGCIHIASIPRSYFKHKDVKVSYRRHYGASKECLRELMNMLRRKPISFRESTGFTYNVFRSKIRDPLVKLMTKDGMCGPRRRLTPEMRIYRWLLYMRGTTMHTLKREFGETQGYTNIDVRKITILFARNFHHRWIKLATRGSREYNGLVGGGDFALFPNIPYAADITQVPIAKPPKKYQADYYDKHKGQHSVGFFAIVDGLGIIRKLYGPSKGQYQDVHVVDNSTIRAKLAKHLKKRHRILYDKGLASRTMKKLFVTPKKSNSTRSCDLMFNWKQRGSRAIVEHVFGRIKTMFPLMAMFRKKRQELPYYFYSTAILYNISVIYCEPMRSIVCKNSSCYYCHNTC